MMERTTSSMQAPTRAIAEQQNIIIVNNLSKQVRVNNAPLEILKSISFTVKRGESIAIVGTSGCGKSTLLSLLAGLDSPSQGQVFLDGAPLHQLDEEQRTNERRKKVGFIFQSFLLLPALTALENIMLPAQLANIADAEQKARQLLVDVGLSERANHYPNQLSGGEQQRVAVARAFITAPKILFADEPTGNLDSENGHRISELMFKLNRQHLTTLVLVTHDQKLASHCQRVLNMDCGTIINTEKELSDVV
ncbi:MAG: ABC transporter ATP-binding protein [Gammaproteobacteria bacterium]|nr:ABC transporter ATP-binding protein [Gammaproteobacteria bacterium]